MLGAIGVMTDPSRGGGSGSRQRGGKSQHIFGYLSCIHTEGERKHWHLFFV